MSSRATLPALAAATFLAGFGVAELTGVRALGGLVLLVGGAWCARLAFRLAGPAATVVLVVIALALFVVSHPLGHVIGAWPAVIVSALAVAVAADVVTRISRRPDAAAVGGDQPGCLAGTTLSGATGRQSASRAGRSGVPDTAHE
jgi:hypothetical protein